MSRRPAWRPSRKTSGSEQLVLVGGGLVIAWAVFTRVVSFLAAHPWIPVVLMLVAGGAGAAWLVKRQGAAQWERVKFQGLRYPLSQLDGLHHRQFEQAVRDLMQRDGCADTVQVGGSGDNGEWASGSLPLWELLQAVPPPPFASTRDWSRTRIRCQVPFRCHRRNRS